MSNPNSISESHCRLAVGASNRCSGCGFGSQDLATQQYKKAQDFSALFSFSKTEIHSLGPIEFRDRVDLSWDGSHWGLWSQDDDSRVADLRLAGGFCPLASPALQEKIKQFIDIRLEGVRRASVRLRISPTGQFGIWLDAANLDIKELLHDKSNLRQMLDMGELEIGQKRKQCTKEFKLKDPKPNLWFQTFVESAKLPLFTTIGSFTQTGAKAQAVIAKILSDLLQSANAKNILELGAGCGALTFPAAGLERRVTAVELDELSLNSFKLSLELHSDFAPRIELMAGNFYRESFWQDHFDTVILNPPRSGVGPLVTTPPKNIQNIIYMSCHIDSLQADAVKLLEAGFQLKSAHLIDQFPHTRHAEWLTLWGKTK